MGLYEKEGAGIGRAALPFADGKKGQKVNCGLWAAVKEDGETWR